MFFNLIKEVRAKKKTDVMVFSCFQHFFHRKPRRLSCSCECNCSLCLMPAVFLTARIGISVADAKGPLIATTVANGCFSHPDANVS